VLLTSSPVIDGRSGALVSEGLDDRKADSYGRQGPGSTLTKNQGDAVRTFALMAAMLALAGIARADEDPEPPGGAAALRQLKGTWVSVRRIAGGKETEFAEMATYKFEGDKASYTFGKGGKTARVMKFEADRKRPFAFQVIQENTKAATRYFFKIEKGELHLTLDRSKDPNARPDFSGKVMPVVIYKRQQ
jgi:uncharacterized protein (TIGR03067 family)